MDNFEQPIEGVFRDGIPGPVLRAFAPLYQALPALNMANNSSRDCYFWRANPLKCVDEDVKTVTMYVQASEASFRLCPQESASLLKCHQTEPSRALFFCRDEEWEWRTCLMDKTGVRFWPYANAPRQARWSNGGQTEDFHMEDRHYYTNFSFWKRKAASMAMREREMEVVQHRRNWGPQGEDLGSLALPKTPLRPSNLPTGVI
jgi:hypothetical protein